MRPTSSAGIGLAVPSRRPESSPTHAYHGGALARQSGCCVALPTEGDTVAHREGTVSASACKAADHLHTQTLVAWLERVLAR